MNRMHIDVVDCLRTAGTFMLHCSSQTEGLCFRPLIIRACVERFSALAQMVAVVEVGIAHFKTRYLKHLYFKFLTLYFKLSKEILW